MKPKKGNAALFYSMPERSHMQGTLDQLSLHGGCDPLKGEKWAGAFQKGRCNHRLF